LFFFLEFWEVGNFLQPAEQAAGDFWRERLLRGSNRLSSVDAATEGASELWPREYRADAEVPAEGTPLPSRAASAVDVNEVAGFDEGRGRSHLSSSLLVEPRRASVATFS
jgi:hypothetical protein